MFTISNTKIKDERVKKYTVSFGELNAFDFFELDDEIYMKIREEDRNIISFKKLKENRLINEISTRKKE